LPIVDGRLKKDLKGIGWEDVCWICVAHDWAVVIILLNIQVVKNVGKFLAISICPFLSMVELI
jgi:hypothetical protein